MKEQKPVAMNVRLPRDLHAALRRLAQHEDRSMHWIIIRLLRDGIARRATAPDDPPA
jgi:predicted transcriptional regulator